MYELITFKIDEIPDEYWQKYYNFSYPDKSIAENKTDFTAWKNRLITPVPEIYENSLISFLMQEKEIIADANLTTYRKDSLIWGIKTDLQECIPEIATLFLNMLKQNRSQFDCLDHMAKTPFEDQLFQLMQAKIEFELDYYSLDLQKVDLSLLDCKINDIEKQNSDYRLQFFDMVSDEYLVEYIEIYNILMKEIADKYCNGEYQHLEVDMMKEAYERKKKNEISDYNYLVFDSYNKMIGFTRVLVIRNNLSGKPPYQLQTGILKKHRGKKIATWLKMAMLKKVIANFPQAKELQTDTSSRNHGMKKINEQLGYQYSYTGKMFKLDLGSSCPK